MGAVAACDEFLGMPAETVNVCLLCFSNEQINQFIDEEVVPSLMELRHRVENYSMYEGVWGHNHEMVGLNQRVYSQALRHFAVEECLDPEENFVDGRWEAPYYSPNGVSGLHDFYQLNTLVLGSIINGVEDMTGKLE